MRHQKKRLQLNRFTSWRKQTLISLAKNLILQQGIKTTAQKAKAVKPLVEKLISLAKVNSLAAKREAFKVLGDHKIVTLLFLEIGPRFAQRQSGFTRTINLAKRRGDCAQIVIFELTEIKKKERKKHKKEKEVKPEEKGPQKLAEETEEKKQEPVEPATKEKPPVTKKPTKKFLGGIRNIFKKERDSL